MKIWMAITLLLLGWATAFGGDSGDAEPVIKFKPFPLVNYNSDDGLGYGGRLTMFQYSKDPLIYDWKLWVEFFASTDFNTPFFTLQPEVFFDMPSLFQLAGKDVRFRARTELYELAFVNYYGFGNTDAEIGYDKDKATNYYNSYKKTNPYLYFTLSYPILWDKKNDEMELSAFYGMYFEHYSITNSVKLPSDGGTPKLFTDRPVGIEGGFVYSLMLGLTYDSRDFEANAHKGTYNELAFEISSKAIGSAYDYFRLTFINTFYFEIIPNFKNLVFANRILFDNLFGEPPFFKTEKTGGIDPYKAIGDGDTLRGITGLRYLGNTKLIISPELRFRFLDFPFIGDEMWHLEVNLFSDIGNVWKDLASVTFNFHWTYGAGLKVIWGEDFIISADFAFWNGALGGVYIGFGHQY